MKNQKPVRITITVESETMEMLQKKVRELPKNNDDLRRPSISQLARRAFRFWLAAGAPMNEPPHPAER
jgi:hypothetical protein